MEKKLKPCKCGSTEFCTKPNQYDIYRLVDRKLEWVESTETNDDFILYCRDCGEAYEELINEKSIVTID